MNVMIVDDEQDVKFLFQQKFRKEIKDKKIDTITLVLSDINMPGMNGLELLQKIKEKFNDLPVWMITAYNDEENYQQALDYGCADYLTKPIDFPELKQKILSFPDTY